MADAPARVVPTMRYRTEANAHNNPVMTAPMIVRGMGTDVYYYPGRCRRWVQNGCGGDHP